MTVSQNTSFFKEERPITYEKLNEFYKYVRYRDVADAIISIDSIYIKELWQIISSLEEKELLYDAEIGLLEDRIILKDNQIENREEVISVLERALFSKDKEKYKWGLWGVIGGIVGGLLLTAIF